MARSLTYDPGESDKFLDEFVREGKVECAADDELRLGDNTRSGSFQDEHSAVYTITVKQEGYKVDAKMTIEIVMENLYRIGRKHDHAIMLVAPSHEESLTPCADLKSTQGTLFLIRHKFGGCPKQGCIHFHNQDFLHD